MIAQVVSNGVCERAFLRILPPHWKCIVETKGSTIMLTPK